MQNLIYFDHNATTPMKPEVRALLMEIMEHPCGNPSSIHRPGKEARRRIETARAQVLASVGAGERAVLVFTSGATEANNLVLKGVEYERVLVSAVEHASVLGTARSPEVIPALPSGVVDLEALDKMLAGTDRSTLICVMYVNNETGVIQPVEEVVALAKKHGALVHVDAAQALGRVDIDLCALGADYLTLSAHKIGGPQGAGCLIMSNCVSVAPLLSGGKQEKNMRAGTENIPGIAGFGLAAELAVRDKPEFVKLAAIRDRIEAALAKVADGFRAFGAEAPRVSNTLMFTAPGLSSETQMIALDLAHVCVSSGSACASGAVKPSHVLKAMGVKDEELGAAVRLSLGWSTKEEEAEDFIKRWSEIHDRVKARAA